MKLNRRIGVMLLAVGCFSALAEDAGLRLLEAELARLAEGSGGVMGVAAVHLETGRAAYLNKDMPFPMASTFKAPVAVQLLHRVDQGRLKLSRRVELNPWDLSPGSGTLSHLFDDPGVALSVRNLLELMLLISDNTASDVCLNLAGGGERVTERMRELGVEGVRVDRSTLRLIADYVGVKSLPPEKERGPKTFGALAATVSEEERKAASEAFDKDPRDTATPAGMAKLLELIWKGEALSKESTELLIDIMTRCETGEERLKGLLPKGTVVAHKTGTIGGTTNDVGVITLPHDKGRVVVVAFVKESKRPVEDRERAIAEVARAVHDFFLFTTE